MHIIARFFFISWFTGFFSDLRSGGREKKKKALKDWSFSEFFFFQSFFIFKYLHNKQLN